LEALVIAGFVRGLSVRDVEATLVEALGEAAAVSKSTVSRICEDINGSVRAVERSPPRRRRARLPVPGRVAL
jgi:transposase-like protein